MHLLLLVGRALSAEVSGQAFTAHQSVTGTTTFRSCTFRGCQTSDAGGALFCVSRYVLTLSDCAFATCKAADGGAICTFGLQSLEMTGTTGRNCTAVYDMYCYASIASSNGGTLVVRESSVAGCTAESNALLLCCDSHPGGSTSVVEGVNTSDNRGLMFGSGLAAEEHFGLSIHYCTFARDSPANCLIFSRRIDSSDISCVAVVACSCKSDGSVAGLLAVGSKITIADSVFQGNSFDYFVSVYPASASVGTVTFVKCVFDKTITVTGKLSVATSGCATLQTDLPVAADKCPWKSKLMWVIFGP
jgi:hypothetical protein